MKIKLLFLLITLLYLNISAAQNTPLGNKIVGNDDPANYYIGHFPVPGSDGLDIHWYGGIRFGDGTNINVMQVANGNVGVGTTGSNAKLQVFNNMNGLSPFIATGINGSLIIDNVGSGENYYNASKFHQFQIGGISKMTINLNGNVGIGTANPDEKLTVNGTIHSTEVKVTQNVPADYVFQKYYNGKSELKADYVMPTLAEIEDFTRKNNHLPNVPSAKEIQEKGLSLGEMSNVLLQKVEELTLYVIEQNKKTQSQQEEIECLKAENERYKSLEERLAVIEKELQKKL
jgi:hypothetical protein